MAKFYKMNKCVFHGQRNSKMAKIFNLATLVHNIDCFMSLRRRYLDKSRDIFVS